MTYNVELLVRVSSEKTSARRSVSKCCALSESVARRIVLPDGQHGTCFGAPFLAPLVVLYVLLVCQVMDPILQERNQNTEYS